MDDVEIQVICSQTPERAVNLSVNCRSGQSAGIKVDLRGNDDLFTLRVLLQGTSQIFLTGAGRIAIRRVKKVDAQIQGVSDNELCGSFIQRSVVHCAGFSKTHAANAYL